jgi:hypothetical protein
MNDCKNNLKITFNYKLRLIIFTIVLLFIFKLIVISDFFQIISTFAFETSIFLLLYIIDFKIKKVWSSILFYILYLFHFFISLINTYFIKDILFRKYSLLSIDLDLVNYFLSEVVPINLIIIFLFAVLVLFIVPYFINFKLKTIQFFKLKSSLLIIILLLIIIFIPLICKDNFTSPYINTIQSSIKFREPVELYDLSKLNHIDYSFDFENLFKEIDYPNNDNNLKYKKILVFVAEELSFNSFEEELNKNNSNNFFSKNLYNSIIFNNYYTNNQDSRTALMSMLSGIFIPYEAYRNNNWTDLYLYKILNKRNLVNYFNSINYSTQFVISSIEKPTVAQNYSWNKTITIDNKNQYDFLSKDFVCLHILENQHGCEDKVMLDKLKFTIKHTNNLFLVQEFIFGHNKEYLNLTKMNRSEYYSFYINEIYSFLDQENLLDETLIVFIGDHGSKEYFTMRHTDGYKVPLVFISNKLNYNLVFDNYSHINFADILYSIIIDTNSEQIEIPKNNLDYILFYGSTNSNVFGYLKNNKNTKNNSIYKSNFAVFDTTINPVIESYNSNNHFYEINYMYNLIYNYKRYFELRK